MGQYAGSLIHSWRQLFAVGFQIKAVEFLQPRRCHGHSQKVRFRRNPSQHFGTCDFAHCFLSACASGRERSCGRRPRLSTRRIQSECQDISYLCCWQKLRRLPVIPRQVWRGLGGLCRFWRQACQQQGMVCSLGEKGVIARTLPFLEAFRPVSTHILSGTIFSGSLLPK